MQVPNSMRLGRYTFDPVVFVMYCVLGIVLTSQIISYVTSPTVAEDNGLFIFVVVPSVVLLFAIKLLRKYTLKNKDGRLVFLLIPYAVFTSVAEITNQLYPIFFNVLPFPSWSDVFWMIGNVFSVMFLYNYMIPLFKQIPPIVKIFSVIIAVSFLIPSILIGWSMHDDPNVFSKIIAMTYPIYDSLLLFPTVIGLTLLYKKRNNIFLTFLFLSFIAQTISDTMYLVTYNTYHNGNLIDMGWASAYILLVFALIKYRPLSKSEYDDSSTGKQNSLKTAPLVNLLIPLLAIVIDLVSAIAVVSFYLLRPDADITELRYLIVFFIYGGIFTVFIFVYNSSFKKLMKKHTSDLEFENITLEKQVEQEKINRLTSIGSLSARFAHDMRNPLGVLKNGITLLEIKLGDNIDDKVKSNIEIMQRAIYRMSHQLDEVLDFVTPKSLQLSDSSLKAIFLKALQNMKINDTIKITLPDNDVVIQCDPYKLETVFHNLFTNSIQAGKEQCHIKTSIMEKKDSVIITIQDDSGGMSDDIVLHLFEPLFSTKQTGTGLGLVSCKAIVDKHGGTINVESIFGVGSTFTIVLPKNQLVPQKG